MNAREPGPNSGTRTCHKPYKPITSIIGKHGSKYRMSSALTGIETRNAVLANNISVAPNAIILNK